MKMSLKIDKTVLDKLEKVNLTQAIVRGASIGMIETQKHIMDNKLSGQLLNVRSGDLRRHMNTRVFSRGGKVHAMIGNDMPYARIHEEGGTIRPKTGKFLTVPLPGIQTPRGVTRGGARSFPNTWVWKGGDPWLIMQRIGKSGKSRPLFMLLKSVKIKKKEYLKTGLQDKLGVIYELITREIMRAVG